MRALIVLCGLLVALAALSAIRVDDSGPVLNGSFSVWAQTQPTKPPEGCFCTNPATRATMCKPIAECLRLAWQCGNVCTPAQ
jgi:hypothetical protein